MALLGTRSQEFGSHEAEAVEDVPPVYEAAESIGTSRAAVPLQLLVHCSHWSIATATRRAHWREVAAGD